MVKKSLQKIAIIVLLASLVSGGVLADSDKERFNVALKAFSDNFYEASLSLFERFIDDFPQSPLVAQARLYIGKCYYYNQDYPRALKAFEDLLEYGSQEYSAFRDEIYFFLGLIHFKGKSFQDSLGSFKKIIEDYPDSRFRRDAFYMLGRNYIANTELDKAEEMFLRVVKESQEDDLTGKAYLQLMDLSFKEEDYSRVLSLGSEYLNDFAKAASNPRVYFYLGESYYALEDWEKALTGYKKALDLKPDNELRDLLQQGIGLTYLARRDLTKSKDAIDGISNREVRLYSQGLYYFKTRDYIQALETFNMFIRNYPRSTFASNVYLNKADLFYEMGRLKDSLFTYRYIIDNFSITDHPDIINKAHYGLAWCYLKNGEFKEAIKEFKNTIEYTDNPTVKLSSQIQIADAYQEAGRYIEALDLYNNILKENPGTIYADYIQFQIGTTFLKSRQLEKALMALRNLKNNFPDSKLIPRAQYYLSVAYFTGQDYVRAKALLEDFFEKYPQNELIPRAYYLYGKCFFNEGKYRKAIEVFQTIINDYRDKDIEEFVYIDMGNAYVNMNLYDEAKKTWEEFLTKYRSSEYAGSVLLYLGGISEKENNYDEAEKYYRRIIEEYSESAWVQEALFSLGHLYWSKGNIEKAKGYFQELAGQGGPLSVKGKLYLARILSQRGEGERALDLYKELSNTEDSVARVALLNKAFLLKDLKQYSKAAEDFKQVIEEGLDNPEIRFSLALCLEKTGNVDKAIEEYFKAIYKFSGKEGSPGMDETAKDYSVKSYFRLAKLYEKKGEIKEAARIYQKIIDMEVGESKIAKKRLEELQIE